MQLHLYQYQLLNFAASSSEWAMLTLGLSSYLLEISNDAYATLGQL